MSSAGAKLLVYTSSQLACIKIQGKANFTNAIEFKDVFNKIIAAGFHCLVLELTECTLMDSTFLGVLANYAIKLSKGTDLHPNVPLQIELLNPAQRVVDSLNDMGTLHFFRILTTDAEKSSVQDADFKENVSTAQPTKEEITLNCLEAHRVLMELNPENVPKFREVARFMEEELKRLRGEGN